MTSLDLDSLRSFAVFAEKLNFTHAAAQLHISQPALYVRIRDLGDTLGIPLYRKIGRQLELTEQGKFVARFAREIVSKADAFIEEIRTGSSERQVVLASGEGAFLYLLGQPIREFLKTGAKLKLITSNRDGIIDAIQSGKADLGVTSLETTPDGCESRILHRADQVLVMPEKHPLAKKRSLRITDLNGCMLVVPPPERPQRQMLSAVLQSARVEWEVAVEAVGWEVTLHFVKLGIGLAVVNAICDVPRGLTARRLAELPQVHYHLLHLRGAAKTGAVSLLKELLLATRNTHAAR